MEPPPDLAFSELPELPPWLGLFSKRSAAIPPDDGVRSIRLSSDEQAQIMADNSMRLTSLQSVSITSGLTQALIIVSAITSGASNQPRGWLGSYQSRPGWRFDWGVAIPSRVVKGIASPQLTSKPGRNPAPPQPPPRLERRTQLHIFLASRDRICRSYDQGPRRNRAAW